MNPASCFKICLQDLAFYSRIGVFTQERKVGNEFRVSISIKYDASDFEDENLETTISYADVYEIIKLQMDGEHLLLESVAKCITDTISKQWKNIVEISTSICKVAPPIPGITGSCAVEYFWKKS